LAELRRRTALSLGQPEPRMPTRPPIERLFGSYAVAVGEAKLLYELQVANAEVGTSA
jgi:hypothetical protein